MTLMRGRSALSRTQREMIGVVVSSINNCHY
jgi:AhpD family alkylhydroperoxidase